MEREPINLSNRECKRLAILIQASAKQLHLDPLEQGIPYEILGIFDEYKDFSNPNVSITIAGETAAIIAEFCLRVYKWTNDVPTLENKSYGGDYITMAADLCNGYP